MFSLIQIKLNSTENQQGFEIRLYVYALPQRPSQS